MDRTLRASRRLAVAMAAWAVFVWSTRIRNAWTDHEASLASKWGATLLSATFLVLAVATVVALVRSRGKAWSRGEALLLRAFAAWTTAVWLVFGTLIVVHHHPIAFKAVHVGLGLISIGLSVATWRSVDRVRLGSTVELLAVEPSDVR